MALNSGTPVTSWPVSPSSTELVDGFNRIEGNIEDLEDSKIENISGVVDFTTGSDADVTLEFTPTGYLLWDESEDLFDLESSGQKIAGPIKQTKSFESNTSFVIGAGSSALVPQGLWLCASSGLTSSVRVQIRVSGTWRDRAYYSGALDVAGFFWSDGANVRIYNSTTSSRTAYLRRVA